MSCSKILGSDDDVTYERTTNENPFYSEDVSGSTSGIAELSWLQVDIHDALNPELLVPVSKGTKEAIAIHKQIEEWFGVDWPAVLAKDYSDRVKSFYDELRHLGSRPVEAFGSSPPPHSPSRSLREHESSDADTTPTQPTKYLASILTSKIRLMSSKVSLHISNRANLDILSSPRQATTHFT